MLEALLTPQMAAAFVLAIAGGMIRGYTGFGTPMFLAPIYAVLFGPQATVPLMIMIEIGIMAQMLPTALPQADWPELQGLLVGVRIGAGFFHGTSTRVFLRWALATLLVSALVGIFG